MIKFTSEKYQEKYENESGKFKMSEMLINFWEFKIDNQIDSDSYRMAKKN